MPYRVTINVAQGLSTNDKIALNREFDLLRAELNDINSKYTALRALLVAGTAPGAGYNVGTTALAAPQFTPT